MFKKKPKKDEAPELLDVDQKLSFMADALNIEIAQIFRQLALSKPPQPFSPANYLHGIPQGNGGFLPEPPTRIDPASLEKTTGQHYGWRVMELLPSLALKGSYGAKWETKTFSATCQPTITEGTDPAKRCLNHLANQQCTCGIYSHRGAPEYLKSDLTQCDHEELAVYAAHKKLKDASVAASSLSHGLVASYEFGYRSSECTLERLWLVRPRKCRAGHQQVLQKATMRWACGDTEDYAEVAAICIQMNYGVPCTVVPVLDFLKELEG